VRSYQCRRLDKQSSGSGPWRYKTQDPKRPEKWAENKTRKAFVE
jgi:hypothetical protein